MGTQGNAGKTGSCSVVNRWLPESERLSWPPEAATYQQLLMLNPCVSRFPYCKVGLIKNASLVGLSYALKLPTQSAFSI